MGLVGLSDDLFRGALGHDLAAIAPAVGAEVNDPVTDANDKKRRAARPSGPSLIRSFEMKRQLVLVVPDGKAYKRESGSKSASGREWSDDVPRTTGA